MAIKNCPICNSSESTVFLDRKNVPVHQNLIMKDFMSAIMINRGDLMFTYCGKCGFIFNSAFDFSKLDYSENYDNTQIHSPLFNDYIDGLIHYLIAEKGIKNSRIVEVGCGKGQFLKRLVENQEYGNVGYGFDPSYIGPVSLFQGRLNYYLKYYGPDDADLSADVVICRHVIEHTPQPLDLLKSIQKALSNSTKAKVFFETPCVEWILRNEVFWDFFYEHCPLFNQDSIKIALELAGFEVESIKHIFGGQYLWVEASVSENPDVCFEKKDSLFNLANHYSMQKQKLKEYWEAKLVEITNAKRLALWGAGAKGVTFANLIDPERKYIECVVDINSQKQGKFLPGTGHQIVGYTELKDRGIDSVILMNPNYYHEVSGIIKKDCLGVSIIQ